MNVKETQLTFSLNVFASLMAFFNFFVSSMPVFVAIPINPIIVSKNKEVWKYIHFVIVSFC